MNKCFNCSHEPHEGHCLVIGDGMLAKYHLKPGEQPCRCYTEKATAQVERREAPREKCRICEEVDADFQGLCLRCIRQNSVKYPEKKDK